MKNEENIQKHFRVNYNDETKKIIIEIDSDAFSHVTPAEKIIDDPEKAAQYYVEQLQESLNEGSANWNLFGIILDDISESIEESAFFEGVSDVESDIDYY